MKNKLLSFLLSTSCFAAINVPLIVQEALYSGGAAGIARANEPLTVGVPLPDSAGITSTNVLGLTGASAAQFMVEGRWPSGNIKWLKVRAVVPSMSAGGKATVTLTDSGSGDFGGASLATDNGSTITVSTGTATFTIRKANFNGVDAVDVGSTHVVTSGASQGFVVMGPDPTAAYPGNVTCLPTAGGTPCTTIYRSSNDPNSTVSIEENGPAVTVLKCTGDLIDAAGNAYMHYTARFYFYQNQNYVRVTPILRNADYGASNTVTTASKGHQGFELRIQPNLTGILNYAISNHTGTPTTGTLNQAGGTDNVYIYQAESNLLKSGSWCASGCVPYTTLSGYSIVANGSASLTGTASQYPQGWADIRDSSGAGVQIGQEQFAAYGNKSLEFLGGGTDARIGVLARENNSIGTSSTTSPAPYYMAWPQWSIPTDVYLNFHATNLSSPSNEFLKLQHPLLARADYSWYNTAAVFPYPFLSPSEEDAYYANVTATASPKVASVSAKDLVAGSTSTADTLCNEWVCIFRFYGWASPGGSNQMEFRLGRVYNFLRRGFTGGYLNAMYFYKFSSAMAFPMSDGFKWSAHGPQTQYYNYPCIGGNGSGCAAIVSANSSLVSYDWVEPDMEHGNIHGLPDFYFISGDETIKDAVIEGYKDAFLSTTSVNNYLTKSPAMWNDRAIGNALKNISHLYNFLTAVGDPDSNQILTNGETAYAVRLHPDLCAYAGYPAGCTPDPLDNNGSTNLQVGTSKVRGVSNIFRDTSVTISAACSGIIPSGVRTAAPFMNSIKLEGMWEFYQVSRPAWVYRNEIFDNAYGSALWAIKEMYSDNGQLAWPGNGFRYKQAIDYPNSCNTGSDFAVKNEQTVWFPFFILHQYEGGTSWQHKFDMLLQQDVPATSTDEFWYYTVGAVINTVLHPKTTILATTPISGFIDNGGGSYTITWGVPASTQSYRIKWGTKQIVDWIGFDASAYAFTGNPATTMNWFAATDAPSIPTPSGSVQSLTINTGVTGLAAANFMVKAYISGGIAPPPPPPGDTTPPTVSWTAPAAGATLSNTVTLSVTATDNVGVGSVQFTLDGGNLGNPATGSGPSYTLSWDTKTVGNGTHTLGAIATDTSNNTGVTAPISVTVSNAATAPLITSVLAVGITSSAAAVTWNTNVNSDTQVTYGTTTAYGSTSPLNSSMVTAHSTSLTGLAASTTYHFKAMSRDALGNLANSGDFTFTTAAPSTSGGTSVPLNTWTPIPATGWPVEILNYDKSEYVASRKLHCVYGAYKQYLSSEHNNAIVCYSYEENRWVVLENNGYWHDTHAPGVGHTVSVWAYMSDKDAIAYQADGSGSNSPEKFAGLWWWYDMGGLSGQNRTFSPRPWLGVQTPLVEMLTYDQYDQKLILYDQAGAVEVCDPNTNACAKPTISGTSIPGNLTSGNMVYNTSDHKMYIYGGGGSDVYTFSCNTNACTSATGAVLSVTCTGPDCTSGKPPGRLASGMAYSSTDNIFMMAGGIPSYASSASYNDTWIFDPTSLAWTELSPANNFFATRNFFTADRLTYDQASNVFLMMSINGYSPTMYAFPYSPALNYGRVSNTYTPPTGSMNRVQPAAGSQSWAFDPVIVASGSISYAGWIETGANQDNSTCGQTHHPYVQSTTDNINWTPYPTGTQAQACTSIDPDLSGSTNDSKLRLAVVSGTLWEAHEKINHNQSYYSAAFARQWTGGSWSGGAVGCFFAACGTNLRQNPQALVGVGSTPTLAVIEWNHSSYTPEGYIYVAQWNGSAWTALGPKLNINGPGTQVLEASLATDGSSPAACWSEQVVANDRRTVTTTPQVQCAQWNGSAWSRFGSKSLNQSASSWASDPTMTYAGGKFYIGWTERTTAGVTKVYVCRWDGSSCTLLGGALNINAAAGWAAHPSLTTDGTNIYLAWEEQPTPGQHSMGYVKKWDGSSWSPVGGALNMDLANGSVEGITMATVQGTPTAIWGELTYGNLRQVYSKQWNGTNWTSAGVVPPTLSCDLNGDGTVNLLDVQSAINQALGTAACSTADLQQTGQCTVVDVQRVINASLGGACVLH